MRPDFRRLANDYAGAVVDEEMRADLRAGMNIDAGAAVRPLGHDARNQAALFRKAGAPFDKSRSPPARDKRE